MIGEIMAAINNYFPVPNKVIEGNFCIVGGLLDLPLQPGQWYKIVGSVFNDGVYQYGNAELINEEFTGYIFPLAPPREFLALVREIEEWQSTNVAITQSPYQAESFGGYSYTLKSGASGNVATWQDIFDKRLRRWRRL